MTWPNTLHYAYAPGCDNQNNQQIKQAACVAGANLVAIGGGLTVAVWNPSTNVQTSWQMSSCCSSNWQYWQGAALYHGGKVYVSYAIYTYWGSPPNRRGIGVFDPSTGVDSVAYDETSLGPSWFVPLARNGDVVFTANSRFDTSSLTGAAWANPLGSDTIFAAGGDVFSVSGSTVRRHNATTGAILSTTDLGYTVSHRQPCQRGNVFWFITGRPLQVGYDYVADAPVYRALSPGGFSADGATGPHQSWTLHSDGYLYALGYAAPGYLTCVDPDTGRWKQDSLARPNASSDVQQFFLLSHAGKLWSASGLPTSWP